MLSNTTLCHLELELGYGQAVLTVVLSDIPHICRGKHLPSVAMSTSHLVWFKLKLSRLVVVLVSLTTVLADIYQFRDHGAGWL